MFDWRDEFAPAIVDGAERTPHWHTLRYRLDRERSVTRWLRLLGLEPIVLTFTRHLPRKQGVITRWWLPTYMFLHVDREVDRWQQLRRLPGVIGGLLGDPPVTISEADFHDLQARCPAKLEGNDEFTVIPVGSEVQILTGPLEGQTGLISKSRGRSCWVELVVFNRPASVELRTRDVKILR